MVDEFERAGCACRWPKGIETPAGDAGGSGCEPPALAWLVARLVIASCRAPSTVYWHLRETGPLSQGVQARRKALRIRHVNGMEVRKKRPRGFKKRPGGVKKRPRGFK